VLRRLGSVGFVFGFVTVAACSSDGNPNAATEAAIDANSKALCEKLFGCCSESELADLSFVDSKTPPSLAGCEALHSKNGRDFEAATNTEASEHRIVVHLDKSNACVADVKALSCSDFHSRLIRLQLGDIFSLCQSAIVEPLVADDGDCKQYSDCKGGICDSGKCKTFPAEGQPCTPDNGCVQGTRCDPDANTCKALVAKGGTCDYDEECASGACGNSKCTSPGRCGG
jgi:hypothetical protein